MGSGAALVTGASKRIGKDIVLKLAQNSIDIALHYNESSNEALELKEEVRKLGVKCEVFASNLNKEFDDNLISDVVKKFPNLNILVNNASIFEHTPFLETNEDQFDRHFNINFKAPFFLSKYFAKKQKKGVIINLLDSRIASTSRNYFSYLLSKKVLADFTKMAAKELGPDIRVNAVAPGITQYSSDIDDTYYFDKVVNLLPLKKIALGEEISSAVYDLIKNDALTGQILFIDGGESL